MPVEVLVPEVVTDAPEFDEVGVFVPLVALLTVMNADPS